MKTLVVILVSLSATACDAQTSKVVVLRNGNVLEGQVDRLADGYYLTTKTSEFRLAERDVERIAASLQDAYAAKRSEVRDDSASDRIQLATWCMRNQLWQAAATELAAARSINDRNPQLGYLEQRLRVLSRPASEPTKVVGAKDQDDSAQQQAAESARLEALATELPAGSLEEFARHIQPILVNGCAGGGCHSKADQREFQLNRDLIRGVANRQSTLRNLEAVLRFVDEKTPTFSPLLLQPAVPHGGLPHPVFAGPRQKAHERLVAWVEKTTGAEQPGQATEPATDVELAGHQGPPTSSGAPGRQAPQKHFWEHSEVNEGAIEQVAPMQHVETQSVRFGAQLQKFEPRDEFDPDLFNRLHSELDPPGDQE